MENTTKSDSDTPTFREKHKSGWLVLAEKKSAAKIVDALLDLPPYREFNQTELADLAGVSRQSVSNHLDLLLGVGILEGVEGTNRYRFNQDSEVSKAIVRLDGAMNAAGPNAVDEEVA